MNYVFSEMTFMTETKGLTHWFLANDGTSLWAWNLVRNTSQLLLEEAATVIAMAVDPVKGYLFLADSSTVRRYTFVVDLGLDYMSPKITLGHRNSVVVFRDENINSLTVDQDHSILYMGSQAGITALNYTPEIA